MAKKLPHPIPYQGSKRMLAPMIYPLLPSGIATFYEPFAGSAAMTLFAAHHGVAKRYVLGDTLEPIIDLWASIIERPSKTSKQYAQIWQGQATASADYFNRVRERYNAEKDPVDLLYLICRCVKNAVRFNGGGRFTQSHDKRRLGMAPDKMEAAIAGASTLLRGKTEFRKGDWTKTTADATPNDFVYMDPPYMGTSIGRDKRYHQQLLPDDLIVGLNALNSRSIRFALSYDGMTGEKEYGPELPSSLGMTRLLLHAGRSSQATLQGKSDQTIESLYLSGNLKAPSEKVFRQPKDMQAALAL
ncbi:DNA adenine methylase [Stenotrophomonas maltophilia]|uniref:site-specific DNA-methyltransferase (adenine-specific) n=1 Tax=Stenotrophomonas maltophilia TaxID=40324 RepID=A0AAI9C3J9_STEMA|nr:DNA adenine methylase [Stenotrophomonas maltophilia]AWT13591.1 DNA methyltransferase [Stenotrophomonas maltophilia]EKT4093513.1 DNA adenine methylase [Stenotrophomonas maltophilia]MBA0360310.1 DNA adenine methylase [Stenotrophomonas maltophilia]HEL4101231.1 DNA adenine methylase [Stenotrophomonas maltophilia]HEL5044850.1 DNA adenine methylase [Stenotrophomonas maltophilia]